MTSEFLIEAVKAAGFEGEAIDETSGIFAADELEFAWDERESGEVLLWCALGKLAPDAQTSLLERLLEDNCFGDRTAGGHIGLYAPTRTITFSYAFKPGTDVHAAGNIIAAFVAKAAELIGEVNDKRSTSSQSAEPFCGILV